MRIIGLTGGIATGKSTGNDDAWCAPEIPFDFPVVAKPANGEPYDVLEFEGKRKIWFIDSPAQAHITENHCRFLSSCRVPYSASLSLAVHNLRYIR